MPGTFSRHQLKRKPLVSDPGMHHGTCVTHVPWCMSGSQTGGGGKNVPGIPGACATCSFTHLARGPLNQPLRSEQYAYISYIIHEHLQGIWLTRLHITLLQKKFSPNLGMSGHQQTYCGCKSVDLKLFLIFNRGNKNLFYDHHMRSWSVWGQTSEDNISIIMLITVKHGLGITRSNTKYHIEHHTYTFNVNTILQLC